jgi:WD40 repeat protein
MWAQGVVLLLDERHIITSSDSSLRLWDLESNSQVGDDCRNEEASGDEQGSTTGELLPMVEEEHLVWRLGHQTERSLPSGQMATPSGYSIPSDGSSLRLKLPFSRVTKTLSKWIALFCNDRLLASGSSDKTVRL